MNFVNSPRLYQLKGCNGYNMSTGPKSGDILRD